MVQHRISNLTQNILMYSKLFHGVAVAVGDHPGVGEGKPAPPGGDEGAKKLSSSVPNMGLLL